jgi:hypothetical protein
MEILTSITSKTLNAERIKTLIFKHNILPSIAAVDLEMVKIKLQDKNEGLGWTIEQCEEAEIEYKRFLHLVYKYPDAAIVPHTVMDLMWHQHILDTRAYHKDCQNVFGEYLHHFPYFGIRSEEDRRSLDNAFDETQIIYKNEFKESMLNRKSSHCKRACVSYCKRACNK